MRLSVIETNTGNTMFMCNFDKLSTSIASAVTITAQQQNIIKLDSKQGLHFRTTTKVYLIYFLYVSVSFLLIDLMHSRKVNADKTGFACWKEM